MEMWGKLLLLLLLVWVRMELLLLLMCRCSTKVARSFLKGIWRYKGGWWINMRGCWRIVGRISSVIACTLRHHTFIGRWDRRWFVCMRHISRGRRNWKVRGRCWSCRWSCSCCYGGSGWCGSQTASCDGGCKRRECRCRSGRGKWGDWIDWVEVVSRGIVRKGGWGGRRGRVCGRICRGRGVNEWLRMCVW